jgi:NAD(P)-dependent dehydrogenase (short-subunit alcohol dehydrogenase family)
MSDMRPREKTRSRWTATDFLSQQGRTAVITGSSTGLGFETARMLAERRTAVILACRDLAKATAAANEIRRDVRGATVHVLQLDLGSLASVRAAAEQFRAEQAQPDLLINNAGVMIPPYGRTDDGFERQLGINHLGHFAFTGLVLDRLLVTAGSRIVTVSSLAHKFGKISFDDPNFERQYRQIAAYGQSKLANLMFTDELQRRLRAADVTTVALAAHPGNSWTELQRHIPSWMCTVGRLLPSHSSVMGALPTLRAATDPAASGGEYYGPSRRREWVGYPVRASSSARSHDADAQRRLWQLSERLTKVTYEIAGGASWHIV